MKIKKLTAGLLTAALTVSMSVIASAGEISNLFYTYTKDNVLTDYYDTANLASGNVLEQRAYSAFVSLKDVDMDGDGTDELLAIRLKPSDAADTVNRLVAEIYQLQENKLQRIAQYDLVEDILNYDKVYCDVFTVQTEAGIYLCCENRETAGILADGVDWTFRSAHFDGTQFVQYCDESKKGSDFSCTDFSGTYAALNGLGLYPTELIYTPLTEQASNTDRLCTINRYHITEYQPIADYRNSGSTDPFCYGETMFYDYANEGVQNKVQGDLYAVKSMGNAAVTQTQPDQTSQQQTLGSDYIIADSDRRYITSDELDRLTEKQILLARNEIYARRGRKFKNDEIRAYFESKSWYNPTYSGEEFDSYYAAQLFNDYEFRNIDTIVAYEKAHGYNGF